jgi:hypothetical protein
MKYATEMGSGAMIHISNFTKFGAGVGVDKNQYTYTDTQTAK